MAASARASFEVAAVAILALALALALSLAGAAAPTKQGHSQCSKYPSREVENMQRLLSEMAPAPVGCTIRCGDDERNCLFDSLIHLPGDPDVPCERLGSQCKQQDGCAGMVRASLYHWHAAGRLVGECAPPPRCNATHVLVRPRWFSPAEQCVQAGQLLCACARLDRQSPFSPFRGVDCVCDGEPTLQPAPFGGYECVRKCHGTCSPQIGRPRGSCAFPPLAVDGSAVVYATHQNEQPKLKVKDDKGGSMRPPPKFTGNGRFPWDAYASP
ncbi:hypothetical protein R5R35_006422 [Gryllus longicercus]|uniref:Accessory gland protein n=1 Tax=Gryllus longicercus TaxID=2509291 RepID=A0AAN9W194_9ORTH